LRTLQNMDGFKTERNYLAWVSGESSYGLLNQNIPDLAKRLYAEAESCLLAGAPDAAACMCRAAVEAALENKGYGKATLNDSIAAARAGGALTDVETGMAHANRLIAIQAIHRGELLDLSEIPAVLVTAVRVLNKLYP